jgi:endonuclease YncB( thermonuclease family)
MLSSLPDMGHARSRALAVLLAFGACGWAAPAHADPCEGRLPPSGARIEGIVRYVGDGDGLCIGPRDRPDQWIEVRLGDFNAPELGETGGRRAKRALATMVIGRMLVCRAGRRTYDRVVGFCTLNGKPVGALLRGRGGAEGGR